MMKLGKGQNITAMALNIDNTNLLVSTEDKQLIIFTSPSVSFLLPCLHFEHFTSASSLVATIFLLVRFAYESESNCFKLNSKVVDQTVKLGS